MLHIFLTKCVKCSTAINVCVLQHCNKRVCVAAPRHSGDTCGFGPTGPGYGETERRGTGTEIRVRGGLLQGHSVVVAAHQTEDVVSFRRTLLVQFCQGESDNIIRIFGQKFKHQAYSQILTVFLLRCEVFPETK